MSQDRPIEYGRILTVHELNVIDERLRKHEINASATWFINTSPKLWCKQLASDAATAVQIARALVEFVLPKWQSKYPDDTVPVRVVETVRGRAHPASPDIRQHLQALAKGCTLSRKRSFGYDHRIAEAARLLARAAAAANDADALELAFRVADQVEDEIIHRFAVKGVYRKESEVRRDLLNLALDEIEAASKRVL